MRIAIILTFLLFTSCNGTRKNERPVFDDDGIVKGLSYKAFLPDTVFVNEVYSGKIIFKSDLSNYIKPNKGENTERFTFFTMYQTDKINYDIKELELLALDTISSINNEINIYDLYFSKEGVHYIDGILQDMVFIDTIRGQKKETDLLQRKKRTRRITKKIIAIDKF